MLRIIHTADVHLGARHDDLGEQAAAQRERQFAAFKAAVDLALDREGRPVPDRRRPVRLERPAAPLRRARRRRAQAPRRGADPDGHHPGHPRRLRPRLDLPRLRPPRAGRHDARATAWSRSSTRTIRRSTWPRCDAVVHGRVFADQARAAQPARRRRRRCRRGRRRAGPVTWHIGLVHGSIAIPGKTDRDEVVITTDEIAASGLDYLALGHWHSAQSGKAGASPTPTPARRRRSPSTRIGRARSSSSSSTSTPASGPSRCRGRQVGKTRFEKLEIDAATVASQPALVELLDGPRRPGPRPRRPAGRRPSRRPRPRPRRDRDRRSRRRSSRSASATPRCRP